MKNHSETALKGRLGASGAFVFSNLNATLRLGKNTLESSSHLYSRLRQPRALRKLFPGVNVRILGPVKSRLQLFQLFAGKCRSAPTLFPFQRDPRFAFGVGIVAASL